jgi:hypothetical protein
MGESGRWKRQNELTLPSILSSLKGEGNRSSGASTLVRGPRILPRYPKTSPRSEKPQPRVADEGVIHPMLRRTSRFLPLLVGLLLLLPLPLQPALANGDPDEVVERRPPSIPPPYHPTPPPPGSNGLRGSGEEGSGESLGDSDWNQLQLLLELIWGVIDLTP